jgi:hypothetical protein
VSLNDRLTLQARNKQAMNEIRKVINWAQQPVAPPHSSAAGAAVGASCPVRPGSSQRHRAAQQQQQLDSGSAPSSPAAFAPDALGCGLPPHSPAADAAELLPDGTRAAAGPLPVTGGSARHAQLSSHARHHRHHQQGQHQGRDRYGDRASERYGELLVTAAASSAEGIAGSTNISHGSTGSTAGPMAGAGQSGDLEVESSKQARSSSAGHTAVAAAARRSSGGRDTAPLVPLASSSHEALQLHPSGSGGIGRGRMRGGAESPTRRSSGSKQHLLAAAAAVQHRAQPDQHTHHHQQQALELGRDDLLLGAAPGLGQEGSLDTQEGHLLCSGDSRSELPSDGSTRWVWCQCVLTTGQQWPVMARQLGVLSVVALCSTQCLCLLHLRVYVCGQAAAGASAREQPSDLAQAAATRQCCAGARRPGRWLPGRARPAHGL